MLKFGKIPNEVEVEGEVMDMELGSIVIPRCE
jgi:hypothetical protein